MPLKSQELKSQELKSQELKDELKQGELKSQWYEKFGFDAVPFSVVRNLFEPDTDAYALLLALHDSKLFVLNLPQPGDQGKELMVQLRRRQLNQVRVRRTRDALRATRNAGSEPVFSEDLVIQRPEYSELCRMPKEVDPEVRKDARGRIGRGFQGPEEVDIQSITD